MKSRILVCASLLMLSIGSAFAAKGDPAETFISVGGDAGTPDGTPTLTFNVSIAPNDTTTTCPAFNLQPGVGEPVISLAVGPNAVITGTGWNTTQTAFGASFRSEMAIQYYTAAGNQLRLRPGSADASAGGPTNYVGGPIDFTSTPPLTNIQVGPDGILRLGLCETFDDNATPADGRFSVPSTITIQCFNCVNPTGPAPMADLALSQTNNLAGNAALIGNTFQKTLTVTNNGPAPATAITVRDTLPSQLTFVSSNCGATAAGQVVTYTIPGPLASGASNSCVLTVRITSGGTITNTAAITASTPADPTAGNNTTTAQIGPAGGGVAQTPVPALDRNMVLVLLGLVSVLGMVALRQRQS